MTISVLWSARRASSRLTVEKTWLDRFIDPLGISEILPDEKAPTCAAFLARAIDYFAAHGITLSSTSWRCAVDRDGRRFCADHEDSGVGCRSV
jgi:hypothetical protein